MTGGSEPPVIVDRLDHWFGHKETSRQALFDVKLSVEQGSLTVLMGPSGSGKTTLLTLMGTLRSVQSGSVRLLGEELHGADARNCQTLRRRLGFIFQAHNLHGSLTARQNVLMGLQVHNGPSDNLRQEAAADHILTVLAWENALSIFPSAFRGGRNKGLLSPALWFRILKSSSLTSRPPRWTRNPERTLSQC